jgi:hypothetical protein
MPIMRRNNDAKFWQNGLHHINTLMMFEARILIVNILTVHDIINNGIGFYNSAAWSSLSIIVQLRHYTHGLNYEMTVL